MDMIVPFSLAWLKASLPLDSAGLERALASPFSTLIYPNYTILNTDDFCLICFADYRS